MPLALAIPVATILSVHSNHLKFNYALLESAFALAESHSRLVKPATATGLLDKNLTKSLTIRTISLI
jgi:hypothetical protein